MPGKARRVASRQAQLGRRKKRQVREPGDLDMMRSIGGTMEGSSLCGHGQLGFGPIRSALQHFEADFKSHIEEKRCPTGKCTGPMLSPKNTRPYAFDFVPAAPEAAGERPQTEVRG